MGFRDVEAKQRSEERPLFRLDSPGDSITGVLRGVRKTFMNGEACHVVDIDEFDPRAGMTGKKYSVMYRDGMNELELPNHEGEIIRLTFSEWARSNRNGKRYKKFTLQVWE